MVYTFEAAGGGLGRPADLKAPALGTFVFAKGFTTFLVDVVAT